MATKAKAKKVLKMTLTPKPGKKASSVKFLKFSFGATIPTQSFGNVQPHIEVEAASYEEARDFAIPKIEELYIKYAEIRPVFLGKIEVVEKKVAPAPAPKAVEPAAPSSVAPSAPSSSTSAPTEAKPEPVLKAEKAISLATSEDAMLVIQGQIEKSTKIPAEFKQQLLTLCLKKRGELGK